MWWYYWTPLHWSNHRSPNNPFDFHHNSNIQNMTLSLRKSPLPSICSYGISPFIILPRSSSAFFSNIRNPSLARANIRAQNHINTTLSLLKSPLPSICHYGISIWCCTTIPFVLTFYHPATKLISIVCRIFGIPLLLGSVHLFYQYSTYIIFLI